MKHPTPRVQVLVVEDEAALALDLAELLEKEGYTVVGPAARGPQALELFRRHRVDLLLCDIGLQGPWDGIETAQRLAAERPVPLIYLTAMVDRATLSRALPTAPAAYLAKPVGVAGLRAAIEVALAGSQPEAARERPAEASSRETILRLDQHIFLKHNYQFVRLALADIVLLEADNTVTNLVTTGPHYSLRLSLTAALERLSYPTLVRVHRSFAINLQHVSTFSETEATLHELTVPLGRQYKADFLRQFQHS
jgi:DNA-binding LytR/AlgR family response regulator